MTKMVDFYFDFGSPNCYLAYKAMPKFLDPEQVVIKPVLLGGIFKATGNQPPMIAFGGVKGKLDYEMLEIRRFVAHHHLTKFQMNPFFPINTLYLMRMLTAIEDRQREFIEAVNAAMWEDGKDMNDPQIVGQILESAGFNSEDLFAKSQTADVKQQLIDNTQAAVSRGIFGLPTFFVGEAMYFGKDRLSHVAEEIAG